MTVKELLDNPSLDFCLWSIVAGPLVIKDQWSGKTLAFIKTKAYGDESWKKYQEWEVVSLAPAFRMLQTNTERDMSEMKVFPVIKLSIEKPLANREKEKTDEKQDD